MSGTSRLAGRKVCRYCRKPEKMACSAWTGDCPHADGMFREGGNRKLVELGDYIPLGKRLAYGFSLLNDEDE